MVVVKYLGFVLLLALVAAKNEIYDGHSLIEINVKDFNQVKILEAIEKQLDLDVWSHAAPGHHGEILVSKEEKEQLFNVLFAAGIPFEVKVENVKELLDMEEKTLNAAKNVATKSDTVAMPETQIYTYEEVYAYLERLAALYPETVTLVNAGKSFEGRDIKYLKISSSNFENTTKPIVYMESLLHAREWLTLPVTLHAIKKLVIDVTEQDLVQEIDWIILPVANPDGYAHTHNGGRFLRKNRATGYMIGDICTGVDLNRNFDVNWSTSSSVIPCSGNFHGRSPFSEPETANIEKIIDQYKDRIELFLDIHSYGSYVLYGFGNGTLPANGLQLHHCGEKIAQAIDAVKADFNDDYVVGNVAHVLSSSSGSAQDYGQYVGIPYSYTIELPGHGNGFPYVGFLVDPSFIPQAGFETWEGVKAGVRYALDNFRLRAK